MGSFYVQICDGIGFCDPLRRHVFVIYLASELSVLTLSMTISSQNKQKKNHKKKVCHVEQQATMSESRYNSFFFSF